MDRADLDARAQFAAQLAREAGALALRYFHRELAYTAESKGEQQDWVSIADRAVEAHCRARLASAFVLTLPAPLVVLPEQALACAIKGMPLGAELAEAVPGGVKRLQGMACYCYCIGNTICISNGICNR